MTENGHRSKRVAAGSPATLLAAKAKAKRTNSRDWQEPDAGLRSETTLQIAAGTFREEAFLQIIEDCIVPALVESFLRSRTNLPEFATCEHNVHQP